MLFFRVFVDIQPRRSPDSFLGLTPIPFPLSPNSHGINILADPHPLTPIASIFYKNMGGGGPQLSNPHTQFPTPYSPVPLSPLESTLMKNAGGGGPVIA